uniref:Extended FMRFamide-12 n=1 Tax=Karoophasma botterkloofense TaxID=253132 RepID=FAR12_KARBO|nr:RecName: Full=Extended FMRFamide-12; Short=FMRFa-12 [Karoophasma botterkloofense]
SPALDDERNDNFIRL